MKKIESSNTLENWFVLYTIPSACLRVCETLRCEGLNAFLPQLEYYRCDKKSVETKVMFPGYIFIRNPIGLLELTQILERIRRRGLNPVFNLQKEDVSALHPEERELFSHLLDQDGVVRVSHAYLKKGKAVITEGPLKEYESYICKVDKHERKAYLNLKFMGKRIYSALFLDAKMPIEAKEEMTGTVILEDEENGTYEVNLEVLKRQMMTL